MCINLFLYACIWCPSREWERCYLFCIQCCIGKELDTLCSPIARVQCLSSWDRGSGFLGILCGIAGKTHRYIQLFYGRCKYGSFACAWIALIAIQGPIDNFFLQLTLSKVEIVISNAETNTPALFSHFWCSYPPALCPLQESLLQRTWWACRPPWT